MKKYIGLGGSAAAVLILLTGCGSGAKAGSLTAVYGIMAALALLLLTGYCFAIPKKDPWFLLLFSSVLIVNCGYLALALSRDLPEALMANRIAYLGSVCLPLSMWMIIAKVCRIRYAKWLPGVLLALNFTSVLWSQAVGTALYAALVVVSAPMMCANHYALSLFLWGMLLAGTFYQKK